MATPTTSVDEYSTELLKVVTASNVDAATYTYDFGYTAGQLKNGFSIQTGTITDATLTVLGSNNGSTFLDITSDLYGVSSLASSTIYATDIPYPVKFMRIQAVTVDTSNAFSFSLYGPRK